ncbi:MAG: hypothetical protein Kow0069_30790 [Promethearchaeota archaeon]
MVSLVTLVFMVLFAAFYVKFKETVNPSPAAVALLFVLSLLLFLSPLLGRGRRRGPKPWQFRDREALREREEREGRKRRGTLQQVTPLIVRCEKCKIDLPGNARKCPICGRNLEFQEFE